jgi:hypothetical protein
LNRVPAYERENIISRKPLASTPAENYLIRQIFSKVNSSQQSGIGNDLNGSNSGPVVYIYDLYGGHSGGVAYSLDLYGGSAVVFIS